MRVLMRLIPEKMLPASAADHLSDGMPEAGKQQQQQVSVDANNVKTMLLVKRRLM